MTEKVEYLSAVELEELAKLNYETEDPDTDTPYFTIETINSADITNSLWILQDGTILDCPDSHTDVEYWINDVFVKNGIKIEGGKESLKYGKRDCYPIKMWGAVRFTFMGEWDFDHTDFLPSFISIILPETFKTSEKQKQAIRNLLEREYYHGSKADIQLYSDYNDNSNVCKKFLYKNNSENLPMMIKTVINNIDRYNNTKQFINPGVIESLNESRQDKERFISMVGQELADRFYKYKNRIKSPYNDITYWSKNGTEEEIAKRKGELTKMLDELENSLSATQQRKEDKGHSEVIYEKDGWVVRRVDDYAASKWYGYNTTWCITGRYHGHESEGERYFHQYKDDGVLNYYFIFAPNNGNFDPNYNKWAYLEYEDVEDDSDRFYDAKDTGLNEDDILNGGASFQFPPYDVLKELPRIPDSYLEAVVAREEVLSATAEDYLSYNKESGTVILLQTVPEIAAIKNKVVSKLSQWGLVWGPFHPHTTVLESIIINDGVTKINSGLFRNIFAKHITIASSVTDIGETAFLGNKVLEQIEFNSNTIHICRNAFASCLNLNIIVFRGDANIDADAFRGAPIQTLVLSGSSTRITLAKLQQIDASSIDNIQKIIVVGNLSPEMTSFVNSAEEAGKIIKRVGAYDEIKESLILEKTRNELIIKSRGGDNYKDTSHGRNRWERRTKSFVSNTVDNYNRIDMDNLWKKDILDVDINVRGETNNYVVRMKLEGVIAELARQVEENHQNYEYKCIYRALQNVMNSGNVWVSCSCLDWQMRFSYESTKQDYNSGEPENRPADITNPNDTKGAACKHVNLVLSNLKWILKVCSVINNYVHYMKKVKPDLFSRYIFPKIFGIEYQRAIQLDLFNSDDLESDSEIISLANQYNRQRTRFKTAGEYATADTDTNLGRVPSQQPPENEKPQETSESPEQESLYNEKILNKFEEEFRGWFGNDLTENYFAINKTLETPYNDPLYWGDKTKQELTSYLDSLGKGEMT